MKSTFGPPVNREMKVLDRSFFKKSVDLFVAYFPKPQYLGEFNKLAKEDVLSFPQVKHIVKVKDSRGVLLRETLEDPSQLSPITKELVEKFNLEILPYKMDLTYDFWKADDILQAVLPEELLDDVPQGYAQAGHVAHLNLRDEFKPYGELIGQVILDKNPTVETVVDKINTIGNQFRTFPMKLLAGRDDMLVTQQESKCSFKFDFSKVYWNSRLSGEHDRLVEVFRPGEAVADVFGGVGPFSVPAGKKRVICMANDLNPESYKWLEENLKINKVGKFVKPFNLDGREFIRDSAQLLLDFQQQSPMINEKLHKKRRGSDGKSVQVTSETNTVVPKHFHHYVMNLPDSALTFLDEFIGVYAKHEQEFKADPMFRLPTIHCHCFEKYSPEEQPTPSDDDIQRRIHARVKQLIEFDLPYEACSFHMVRKVAPTKPMYCVSFVLPEEVAFRQR